VSDFEPVEFEESSGNVFADIGFDAPAAANLTHKAELVGVLYRAQQERDLTQSAFSRLVGIPQPRLSKLYNGKLGGMSTDKLLDAVTRLGAHVLIRVEAHPGASEDAGRVELEVV
jgi:predicted XRE-type DNA-binding protein